MSKCIHLLISGKVQGVFFRQSLKVIAKKNNVVGWVKNLDDGCVEAILEGNENSVDAVVNWAFKGPANSRVDDVKMKNHPTDNNFLDFEVLY